MLFLSTLGATSVLSIVNIGFGGKSRPHVGYATALDTFIILCFIAVFAALVEFACINFIDTFVKRRKKKQEDLKIQSEQKKEQQIKKASAKIFTENSTICTSPVVIEEDITNVDEENSNINGGKIQTAPITLQVLYTGSSYIEVTRESICSKSPSLLIEEYSNNTNNDEEVTATNGNSITYQNITQVLITNIYTHTVTVTVPNFKLRIRPSPLL